MLPDTGVRTVSVLLALDVMSSQRARESAWERGRWQGGWFTVPASVRPEQGSAR